MWARIAQVSGAADFGNAPQHAVTSAAMLTQRDPWVNMLRSTLAVFGAGVGGADTVTVLPFDSALPDGALGVSKAFSARMARNTQLLLLEESHLGRVLDPGAGSWYIEELTAGIAAKAWEFLQGIEAAGGYQAALEADFVTTQITKVRDQRVSDIAHRRTAVTGVNEFPNLAENPLPPHPADGAIARYGAAFEALRDRSDAYLAEHGERPSAVLIPLGPVAEHNARTTFAANLLASGGVLTHQPRTADRRRYRRGRPRRRRQGRRRVRVRQALRRRRAVPPSPPCAPRASRTCCWPGRRRRWPKRHRPAGRIPHPPHRRGRGDVRTAGQVGSLR